MHISDEELTAYLDGALPTERMAEIDAAIESDAEIAGRVAALDLDVADIRMAYDALLESAPAVRVPTRPFWTGFRMAAAVALLAFGLGLASGHFATRDGGPDWTDQVAAYQVLYTTQTLAASPPSEAGQDIGLDTVSTALAIRLNRNNVAVDGLTFVRAQLLQIDGKPLAQLAYLDGRGNPIAFCLTRQDGPDQKPTADTLMGLSARVWQRNGLGMIIIGPTDAQTLTAAQSQLDAQISL